jgi:hypothetical protein
VWSIALIKEINVAHPSPQVFAGISPEHFAKLTQKARAAGIEMNSNSGRASKMGIEIEWNYAPDKRELTVTCLHTPFFMSADDVNKKLHALVSESLLA